VDEEVVIEEVLVEESGVEEVVNEEPRAGKKSAKGKEKVTEAKPEMDGYEANIEIGPSKAKKKSENKKGNKKSNGNAKRTRRVNSKKTFLLNLNPKVRLRLWNLAIGALTIMLIKLTHKLR
jgi:hypothetical protein